MTNPKCSQCDSNFHVTQMSGVSLAGHEKYVEIYYLCFRCKVWLDDKGQMLQTI